MIYITSPHLGELWKSMQKKYIEENTSEKYTVCLFNVKEGVEHLEALKSSLRLVDSKNPKKDDLIIILDSDAFPISRDWISKIRGYLGEGNEFVAVQRKENPSRKAGRIAHPCFVAWYYKTKIDFVYMGKKNPCVVGYEERKWKPLLKSNIKKFHEQLYGIYDNMIYHHGGGSRKNVIMNHGFYASGMRYWNEIFEDDKKFIGQVKRDLEKVRR